MPLDVPPATPNENDEAAPVDYTSVNSVVEGERRRQSEPIHAPRKVEAATPAPAEPGAPRGFQAARRDPLGGADSQSVASIAYPRPRDNAFAKTPTFTPRAPQGLTDAQALREAQVRETLPATPPEAAEPAAKPAPERTGRRSERHGKPPETETPGEQAQPAPDAAAGPASGAAAEPPQHNAPQSPAEPEHAFTFNGSRYAAPPAQTVPDWLKAAQQNHTPYYANPRPPCVEPAPQQAAGQPPYAPPRSRAEQYADAGYPQELVRSQRSAEEAAVLAGGYGHKSHGAQYASPPQPDPAYGGPGYGRNVPPPSYPPPRGTYPPQARQPQGASPRNPYPAAAPEAEPAYAVSVEEPERRGSRNGEEDDGEAGEPEEKKRLRIPYLGIAVFLAAMLVITLIFLRLSYTAQKEGVLTARAATLRSQLDNHPFAYRTLIETEAAANNLHPAFVAAIIYNESSFNPKAESDVGARGLMQMMPDTAQWVHDKIDVDTAYTFDMMYDPDTNVHYACWYLAYLSKSFYDDPVLVSAAFHAGQTTVRNWLDDSRYSVDHRSIDLSKMEDGPTKNYALRVLNSYAIYRRLYYEGGADAAQASAAAVSP